MVLVAQSDLVQSLPELLDGLGSNPVVISRDGKRVGALVSIERYNELMTLDLNRLQAIARQAGLKFEQHAAEIGIEPQTLLDRLLAEDE